MANCKFCGTNGLKWVAGAGGRWALETDSGEKHSPCAAADAAWEAKKAAKKAEYYEIKDKINALDEGAKCETCDGLGEFWGIKYGTGNTNVRCTDCFGTGHFSANTKKRYLYRARIRIWPSLAKKIEAERRAA